MPGSPRLTLPRLWLPVLLIAALAACAPPAPEPPTPTLTALPATDTPPARLEPSAQPPPSPTLPPAEASATAGAQDAARLLALINAAITAEANYRAGAVPHAEATATAQALSAGIESVLTRNPPAMETALANLDVQSATERAPLEGLAAVCEGQPFASAPLYVPGPGLHTLRLEYATTSPERLISQQDLPFEWVPPGFAPPEMVLCVDAHKTLVEDCIYVDGSGQSRAIIKRWQFSLEAWLVAASTGQVIDRRSIQGSQPGTCPDSLSLGPNENNWIHYEGSRPGFADVQEWLAGYVAP